jgi:hypothetical protein
MTSQYNENQYEFDPLGGSSVRKSQAVSVEQQLIRMQQQMQEMEAEIDYLHRERRRMKSEIQNLANLLRK